MQLFLQGWGTIRPDKWVPIRPLTSMFRENWSENLSKILSENLKKINRTRGEGAQATPITRVRTVDTRFNSKFAEKWVILRWFTFHNIDSQELLFFQKIIFLSKFYLFFSEKSIFFSVVLVYFLNSLKVVSKCGSVRKVVTFFRELL